ncbi:MAG: hypothetical protein LDL33_08860 [Desulfomonile sp.]|nr:hypothetical protein [Desulfomonile sp.]
MTEEQKPTTPAEDPGDPNVLEGPVDQPEDTIASAPEKVEHPADALAEKRGRMVTAGILSAVILSLIVVLVAGIFQLSYRLMMKCPQDLSVNDPALVLWQKMETPRLGEQSSGLNNEQLQAAGLKLAAPSAQEPAREETAEKSK